MEGSTGPTPEPSTAEQLAGLRARIAAIRPFSDFAETVNELEEEVAALVAEERAARPLPRRLQSATDTLRTRAAAAQRARQAAEEAKAAANEAETAAVQAEEDERTARCTLQQVQAELAMASPSPAAVDAGALSLTLESLGAACATNGQAVALVQQLHALLLGPAAGSAVVQGGLAASAPIAVGTGDARIGAEGSPAAPTAPAAGGMQTGAEGSAAVSAAPVGAASSLPSAGAPTGRRVSSPARTEDRNSDSEEESRSRSRERKDTEAADRATRAEISAGRQRTLPVRRAGV